MHKFIAISIALALSSTAQAGTAQVQPPVAADWTPRSVVTIQHPEWSRDAVLYQINTRQFTEEGTFRAAQEQLPRLKELGVDILWLMPIHPIGAENRKGGLGSPYSVKDYYEVNPEFGTKEEFKAFVDAAHRQGFKVILDLVANHTAWDNDLAKQHPDWYEKDWKGDFRPTPWWDWSDIIDLDWSKPGVREHVGGAMEYWVRDFGVDGYRADVAGYVPLDFWETMRARLEAIRPVFMLGEVQQTAFNHKAFDATYAWDWHNTSKNVAQGKGNATSFYGYYAENESLWPREAMRMTYIENHDSNAWEGTMKENYGPALDAMTALSFTGEGLPLVHNGMEACNAKRLEFFEKDAIDWSQREGCTYGALIKDLIAFRKANPVLANGQWGAVMQKIETDRPEQVLAWARQDDSNKVVGLFNFSGEPVTLTLQSGLASGTYAEFRGDAAVVLAEGDRLTLPAWGYRLFARAGE
ncbi:alpha-glucosidase C-terminal domain-containing protein [Qipengyuania sp. 6B39]|uniref:alpha-amylase family glycosyl hydrolase n=1 Tax=Qipengyuania proteolytica TaxID=2867239 RepID=UPI001C899393|nr:alpha-amylase family glycosyl hydrolase [Qipengyuania proteolytica]MBX7495282.1 alpha-glucosidase C-terminal domain-containing protein [Qipengyuania proteolytica]